MDTIYFSSTLLIPYQDNTAPFTVKPLGSITEDTNTVHIIMVNCDHKNKIVPTLYNYVYTLQRGNHALPTTQNKHLVNYLLKIIRNIQDESYLHIPSGSILQKSYQFIEQEYPHVPPFEWQDILFYSSVDYIE